MIKVFFPSFVFLLIVSISNAQTGLYKEKFRPQFHFTPSKNWMNDPNGLVYYNGEYHLFYQYNPYSNRWGHMHWGHAVSHDLLHWQQLPIAISEQDSVMIFSGSAVVDKYNTSGFSKTKSKPPLVAIYTAHVIADSTLPDHYRQEQHIAYSLDNGRTWTKYAGNPVLNIGKKDFRDPKVFWYDRKKIWIMAVVLPHDHIVQFYQSRNLKKWSLAGSFGPAGDVQDIWECPDLLQVPVMNEPGKSKWVLINSQQVTMQYFVGEFDGSHFTNENPAGKIYRPDYGPDYYAGVTYNNLPRLNAPVLIGWANNWRYANDIPTLPWKSAMALPRKLSLKKKGNEYILLQQPVPVPSSSRDSIIEKRNLLVRESQSIGKKGQVFQLNVTFTTLSTAGVNIAVGDHRKVQIGYDARKQELFIDRSDYADSSINKAFGMMSRYAAPLKTIDGEITLQVFFDKSIIEVFANDGEVVMTCQVFAEEKNEGIELFGTGNTLFKSVKFIPLRSIW